MSSPSLLNTEVPTDTQRRHRGSSLWWYLSAGALYLVLGIWSTAHAWTQGVTDHLVSPSGDASLFVWSLQYAANGVAHLSLPFNTSLLFHPYGFNMVANTTSLGIGVPLAPITWIWGPIATLNVALTLAPLGSGLAMLYALRRHGIWWPAAILSGAIWAQSPYVLYAQTSAWLMVVVLVVAPLLWALFHELVVVRRRSPIWVGVGIAALLIWQFFLGTEALAIMGVVGAMVGVAVLIAQLRSVVDPLVLIRRVAIGLGTALVITLVVLAWPLWCALAGANHLADWIWPAQLFLFDQTKPSQYVRNPTVTISGVTIYNGLNTILPNQAYLGPGVVLGIVAGWFARWRDARLWLSCSIIVFGFLMAEGGAFWWSPWQLAFHAPLLHNILSPRWIIVVIFGVCFALSLSISNLVTRLHPHGEHRRGIHQTSTHVTRSSMALGMGALLLILAALPIVLCEAKVGPPQVGASSPPSWFATHHGGVLLVSPFPEVYANALAWEAQTGIHNALVGGWGPETFNQLPSDQATTQSTLQVIARTPANQVSVTPSQVTSLRQAALAWGVTDVMAASPGGSNTSVWGQPATSAVGYFTEAFGPPTSVGPGWWVWHLTPRSVGAIVTPSVSLSCNTLAGDDPSKVIPCLTLAR